MLGAWGVIFARLLSGDVTGLDRSDMKLEMEETDHVAAAYFGTQHVGQGVAERGSTSWVSVGRNTSSLISNGQRELLAASSTSGDSEICETVEEIGRECFWCMQWSCEQGYFKESAPDCYHDTLSPVDDDFHLGDVGTYVNQCSDETCCEESYTGVHMCRGFPSCPSGTEPLWLACAEGGNTTLPSCEESVCCGDNSTSAGIIEVAATDTAAGLSIIAVGSGMVGGFVWGGAGSGAGSSQIATSSASRMGQIPGGDLSASTGARQPSATMSVLLVGQLQFLATLALVDYAGTSSSWLSHLAEALRWVNLWPPDSFAEDFEISGGARRLQEESGDSSACFAETSSELGALVYVGNLVLFASILGALVILHISVASGVEAYWLTKQFALEAAERARLRGAPLSNVLVPSRLEGADIPAPSGDLASLDPRQRFQKGHLQSWPSPPAVSDSMHVQAKGESAVPARTEQSMALLLHARRRSRSAWLYFPHIELLFLFFAFEGALAAQLSAIRENGCLEVVVTAGITLVLYPMLMMAMVYRTFQARVRPDALIVFTPNAGEECEAGNYGADGFRKPSFFSRVWAGVKHDHSLFAWADTGSWETVETTDEQTRREGDQFRIGFEPLFIDFTKNGSWFMMFYLVEVTAHACIGTLIDDSVIQLGLLCGLCSLSSILLVLTKPFANSVINAMAACQSIADAVCMGLLAIAAAEWEGTVKADYADKTVVMIELVCLAGLAIPIYVDTLLALQGAIRDKLSKSRTTNNNGYRDGRTEEERKEERAFVRRYIRGTWTRTWCNMVRSNIFACVRDTSRGVRRVSAAADRPSGCNDIDSTTRSGAVTERATLSGEI
ncbi:unnamed protein product [Scytosiphon promiscuus]